MEKYRVFISYSRKDRKLVEELVELLEEIGLCPMWDRNFAYGSGFHDQIKQSITHAHVFLPLITKESSQRGWVHQEIGYAMANNIPVLPIAKGVLPGEMIQDLHAIQLQQSLEEIRDVLTPETFRDLLKKHSDTGFTLYQCAELAEDRTAMMTSYAESVVALGAYGYVRQKGA